MESKHGSPSKDENNSITKDDALSPLISLGDSDHDSESEAGEKTPGSSKSKKSRTSHPASSSSSSSSSSDLFQMDAKILKKSSTFPVHSPKAEEGSQSPNEKKKSDIDNTSPSDASSQVSYSPGNPTSHTMSPVQSPPKQVMERSGDSDRISPPKQVMERSGDYDPDRIPASVFGNRPSSAMDWSAASNDSLFSLNIGNSSFSRENFLMMSGEFGEDFHKSGELYNSGELHKPGEANKAGLPPLSPIGKLRKIKTMGADKKTMDADKKPKPKESNNEDVLNQFEAKKRELDGNGHSSMINRSSDASVTSSQSFAFPILVDTSKYTSVKGPFPRKQDPKLDVYAESPQMKTHKKKSSSYWHYCCCCCCYCCSLPECSCPSSRHCWSWKWLKKWCCCCCL